MDNVSLIKDAIARKYYGFDIGMQEHISFFRKKSKPKNGPASTGARGSFWLAFYLRSPA
jgi:hypothetical protein